MSVAVGRHAWRPGLRVPAFGPLTFADRLVLFFGTGAGSGFLRPFSASWGSIVGFLYFGAVCKTLALPLALLIVALVLFASVPIAGRCALLARDPDPKCVVIDEIAAVPLALFPLWLVPTVSPWHVAAAFVVYRLADLAKPFPARALERLPGGWGIVLDDVVSALYMGVLWWMLLPILRSL